jgi:predicted Rdx family selenoprotein
MCVDMKMCGSEFHERRMYVKKVAWLRRKNWRVVELCLSDVATRIKNVCLIYAKGESVDDCVCRNML